MKKKRAGQTGEEANQELRNQRIEFYVTDSEHTEIYRKYLDSNQSSLAKFCREYILNTNHKARNEISDIVLNNNLLNQIRGLSTNANQIAKKINSSELNREKLVADWEKTLSDFKEILKDNNLHRRLK